MIKFNYNLFKSNCNSLSKQFNQVHSTCVVYHDLCQQSVAKPINQTNLDTCSNSDQHQEFKCQKQTCSTDLDNSSNPSTTTTTTTTDCKTFSTNTTNHHHHHNHEHGLIYSKRVRSILLLNALLSKPKSSSNSPKESHHSSFQSFANKWQQIRNYAKKTSTKDKKKASKKTDFIDEELAECIDLDDFRGKIDQVIKDLKDDLILNINIRIGTNIELINVVDDKGETFVLKDIARIAKKNNIVSIDCADLPGEMILKLFFIINN